MTRPESVNSGIIVGYLGNGNVVQNVHACPDLTRDRAAPFEMLASGSLRLIMVSVKLAWGRSDAGRNFESASWRKIDMLGGLAFLLF